MRKHEVWDEEGHVEMLEGVWGKPGHSQGRHWEALKAVTDLVRGKTVLDAGCGMGHLYPLLVKKLKGVEYRGFDSSVEMVKRAKENFPHVSFTLGDIYDMSDKDAADTVVSVDVLMHIPEIEVPVIQMWSKSKQELIIVHQTALKNMITTKTYSGSVPLSDGKILINRYDTIESLFSIFGKLEDLGKIEVFYYDPRSHIFRLSRGIPRYGSFRRGWQF